MNVNGMILVLLALGSFFVFRRFSRTVGKSSQNCQARLKRIRNASLLFRMFIGISLLVGLYWVLGFLFGWPFFSQDKVRIVIAHSHIYTSRTEMPPAIFALWLVKTGFGLWGLAVLFALFELYGRGILFAARNVRYIQFLGYWLMIDWIIDFQMQGILHDMDLSTMPLFVGLLIIFVAWIMDEGRKIQEEQELTV